MSPSNASVCDTARGIRLFTRTLHIVWVGVFVLMLAAESIPVPLVRPSIFYSILFVKAALFVILGYLAPLTFWRFDSLTLGILFSAGGVLASELIQAVSPGHSASFKEFAVKVILVFIGFAFALNSRYDCRIHLGPWHVALRDAHRKRVD